MNCRTAFVGLLTILSFPSCLRAQTASIAGSITDSTGAAVSNVKITAQNVDTGVAQTAQRDESGVYRMTNLNPGIYDITIEHPSFKAAFKTRVFTCTSQGQSANVDVGTPNSPNNGTNFGAGRLPRDPIMQQILAVYPDPNGTILDGARPPALPESLTRKRQQCHRAHRP